MVYIVRDICHKYPNSWSAPPTKHFDWLEILRIILVWEVVPGTSTDFSESSPQMLGVGGIMHFQGNERSYLKKISRVPIIVVIQMRD